MVLEHEGQHASRWEATCSIAAKIGCSAESLRKWIRKTEIDSGQRAGTTSEQQDRMKALEQENRELRRANEILRKASAYFAQAELRPPTEMMVSFIDAHRDEYGIEPICAQLPIARRRTTSTRHGRPMPRSVRPVRCATRSCARRSNGSGKRTRASTERGRSGCS
jgi:transposase-like protein